MSHLKGRMPCLIKIAPSLDSLEWDGSYVDDWHIWLLEDTVMSVVQLVRMHVELCRGTTPPGCRSALSVEQRCPNDFVVLHGCASHSVV